MAVSITIGAFGAHALKARLDAYSTDLFKTATLYMMIHSLGLILVGCLQKLNPQASVQVPALLMSLGIILFSGSLFILSITGIRWLGAITPLGGICFIAAWVLIAFQWKAFL